MTDDDVVELEVEGGPRPRGRGEPEAQHGPEPPPPTEILPSLDEVSLATVEALLDVVCLLLHVTLGRKGPPDAYLPSEQERARLALPLRSTIARSARGAALAGRFGDPAAFTLGFGTFLVSETRDVALYRAAAAAGEAPPVPDADLEGIGLRAQRDDEPVRPWRPPPPE